MKSFWIRHGRSSVSHLPFSSFLDSLVLATAKKWSLPTNQSPRQLYSTTKQQRTWRSGPFPQTSHPESCTQPLNNNKHEEVILSHKPVPQTAVLIQQTTTTTTTNMKKWSFPTNQSPRQLYSTTKQQQTWRSGPSPQTMVTQAAVLNH